MPRVRAAKRCRCGKCWWKRAGHIRGIRYCAHWYGPVGRGMWDDRLPIGTFCSDCGDALLAHGYTEPHPARLRQEKETETDG